MFSDNSFLQDCERERERVPGSNQPSRGVFTVTGARSVKRAKDRTPPPPPYVGRETGRWIVAQVSQAMSFDAVCALGQHVIIPVRYYFL
ncbi:hypothetical protein ANTRET_LOCUS763 [Anthophora retusa]